MPQGLKKDPSLTTTAEEACTVAVHSVGKGWVKLHWRFLLPIHRSNIMQEDQAAAGLVRTFEEEQSQTLTESSDAWREWRLRVPALHNMDSAHRMELILQSSVA